MHTLLIRSLHRVLASFESWSGRWVHYTDVNKLGINPSQFHADVAGLYFFPEEHKTSGTLWKKKKYKISVTVLPNAKVLDLSKLTSANMKEILSKLEILAEPKDSDDFWEILKNSFTLSPKLSRLSGSVKWNKAFRQLGYDAIFDDTNAIHVSEPQLVVLNPKVIKVIDVEYQNPQRGQFARIAQYQKDLKRVLEDFGVVTLETPKKYKEWLGNEKRLKGRVTLQTKNEPLVWEIEEDPASPPDFWIRLISPRLQDEKGFTVGVSNRFSPDSFANEVSSWMLRLAQYQLKPYLRENA